MINEINFTQILSICKFKKIEGTTIVSEIKEDSDKIIKSLIKLSEYYN